MSGASPETSEPALAPGPTSPGKAWPIPNSSISDAPDLTKPLPKSLVPAHRFYRWFLGTPGRRSFFEKAIRACLIIGMLGLVTAVLIPELTNTAQPAPDPLTGSWSLVVAAHNSSAISGLVDGDDVVAGNFSVTSPYGAVVYFAILPSGSGNWTEMMSQSVYELPNNAPSAASPVTFTAAYTDWYNFVWTNPGSTPVQIYVSLSYLSSAPPA